MSLLDKLVWGRPLKDADERARLDLIAKDDGHIVIAPSHVVTKEGEIVGYASLGTLPMLHVWLHSKRVQARDSAAMFQLGENILHARGAVAVCLPCCEESPYYEHMDKFGYRRLGRTVLHVKNLRTK